MLVSEPPSSKSAAFRFNGDERGVPLVLVEATDSARDVRPSSMGVADRPRMRLFVAWRDAGGRMEVVVRFVAAGAPGLGRPDMSICWLWWWLAGLAVVVPSVLMSVNIKTQWPQGSLWGAFTLRSSPPSCRRMSTPAALSKCDCASLFHCSSARFCI
jgi:hypothetical protein